MTSAQRPRRATAYLDVAVAVRVAWVRAHRREPIDRNTHGGMERLDPATVIFADDGGHREDVRRSGAGLGLADGCD